MEVTKVRLQTWFPFQVTVCLNGRRWLARQLDRAGLAGIYPSLVPHGMQHFGTPDVMRCLGRVIPAHGRVHRRYLGEVETDLKHRPEGVRLKYCVQGNGLKLYHQHG